MTVAASVSSVRLAAALGADSTAFWVSVGPPTFSTSLLGRYGAVPEGVLDIAVKIPYVAGKIARVAKDDEGQAGHDEVCA
jgi:hypothetical protein